MAKLKVPPKSTSVLMKKMYYEESNISRGEGATSCQKLQKKFYEIRGPFSESLKMAIKVEN